MLNNFLISFTTILYHIICQKYIDLDKKLQKYKFISHASKAGTLFPTKIKDFYIKKSEVFCPRSFSIPNFKLHYISLSGENARTAPQASCFWKAVQAFSVRY